MNLIKYVQDLEENINEMLKPKNIIVKILKDENINKGKIVIFKDKKIQKLYNIEMISCYQINIIENNEIIEYGLFIEQISQWLYNLYNPIKYLYTFYGGNLNGKTLKKDEIDKLSYGKTPDYSEKRKIGALVHRKELDNQPLVKGYLSPMFEKIDYGKVYLRYETQEIYDMLSN